MLRNDSNKKAPATAATMRTMIVVRRRDNGVIPSTSRLPCFLQHGNADSPQSVPVHGYPSLSREGFGRGHYRSSGSSGFRFFRFDDIPSMSLPSLERSGRYGDSTHGHPCLGSQPLARCLVQLPQPARPELRSRRRSATLLPPQAVPQGSIQPLERQGYTCSCPQQTLYGSSGMLFIFRKTVSRSSSLVT